MTEQAERIGITAGGNWIVDRIKTVDHLPGRGMLASIHGESRSTGGAAANVLANLARLGSAFPLAGVGIVGDDADGRLIIETFSELGVDVTHIATTGEAPTSYTDVMNEEGTGDRSFFHHRGANALFAPEHIPADALACRIFHLGYLLLLDSMDRPDGQYGTQAARALNDLQQRGIRTSLDVVSEDSDRFATLVPPALQYVDYLILNEIEATRAVGRKARDPAGRLDAQAVVDAVEELYDRGRMALVAVHMPEGVYLRDRDGNRYSRGSLDLPDGYVRSTVGAGDAFCAGMLYGLHENWPCQGAADLATCAAAATLAADGATDGMLALADVLALGEKFPQRPAPIET